MVRGVPVVVRTPEVRTAGPWAAPMVRGGMAAPLACCLNFFDGAARRGAAAPSILG